MSEVVCFKLINGSEVVGKLSEEKTHADFISSLGVIYLEDAVFMAISTMENGEEGLAVGPLSALGERTDAGKAKMPFALYPNVIMGQIPLSPPIELMYRQATSSIALLR